MPGVCSYKCSWAQIFDWVQPVKGDTASAKGVLCKTNVKIVHNGKKALVQHTKTTKDKQSAEAQKRQSGFFGPAPPPSNSASTESDTPHSSQPGTSYIPYTCRRFIKIHSLLL